MSWVDKYLHIPYADFGRGETGVDCWGLVKMVLKNEQNLEIEGYEGRYTGMNSVDMLIQQELPFQSQVSNNEEKPFDVIFFDQFGCISHCGIVVEKGLMIHAFSKFGVVVQNYDSGVWKRKLSCIYRHEKMK